MSDISFSNDVRREIRSSINDKDKKFACLYGMLLFSRIVNEEHICFQSESKISADLFEELFNSVFKGVPSPARTETMRKNGSALYAFDINGTDNAKRVLYKYRIVPEHRKIDTDLIVHNSHGVFTAGIFLACGSVNDPSKGYHLEFTVPEKGLAGELLMLLESIGVNAKAVLRRGQYVVYVKESESIEDTLTFIGAQQCTLELMNIKIYKDVRNKANRITNCDNANINKVVNAALKQIEDIKLIESTLGLDYLPAELRQVAQLRLENNGMSLRDMGEALVPPISRSGVNHRLKRIEKMADEIRMGRVKKP